MKRFLTPALAAAVLFSACDAGQALRVEVTDRVISSDYVGNGVEWDPYDEAEAWGAEVSDADWAKLSERLDFMRPGYVRCMINSPYRYYDAATGRYDRMRNLASLRRLLQYCQDNGITVAYGEYNPPTWAMKDSQQWVEMSVDYLNFLVCDLGFDCIRHFIIFNEPDGNWASTDGDYDLWRSMAQRFDAEMARYPDLKRKVSLAAPDVVMSYKNPASEYDAAGWVARSAQDLGAQIGIYDVHAYPGQHEVRSGAYAEKLRRIALLTFDGTYDAETVDKWLNVFMRRFFAQQFKRSCMPDGPKVGSVSLSPRGDWRMPSDAVNSAFRPE